MVEIDEIDRTILDMLRRDGRAPYADIARRLSVSPATVKRRVERMMEEGTIERFTVVLNPEKVGKHVAALITIQPARLRRSKIFEMINDFPEVEEAYFMAGKCGIVMRVQHSSIAELSRFIESLQKRRDILSVECCILLKKIK